MSQVDAVNRGNEQKICVYKMVHKSTKPTIFKLSVVCSQLIVIEKEASSVVFPRFQFISFVSFSIGKVCALET